MLFYLVALPTLVLILILQTIVISNLTVIYGSANLMMLILVAWALQQKTPKVWELSIIGGGLFGFISPLPYYVYIVTFLFVSALARLIRRRIWRMPIFVMILMSILGTFIEQFFTVFTLQFSGVPITIRDSLSNIIFPSALLNLLISIPVYIIISDLAHWLYPVEVEG